MLPGIILLIAGLGACGGGDHVEMNTTTTADEPLDRDSIRQVYTERLADRADPYPTEQIAEKGKLNPVDQSPLDTLFFLFLTDLKAAVAAKDVFFVLDHVAKDIKNGFGGEDGADQFVKSWDLGTKEKNQSSELWEVLERVLSHGGTFDTQKKNFYAPYYHATFPSEYDPYQYGAVIGSGVRMRRGPSLSFRIEKTISYNIVKFLDREGPEEEINGDLFPWVKVQLLDETEGFIYGKFVGSPLDYRIGFSEEGNGDWKIVFLVAGD